MTWTKKHSQNAVAAKERLRMERAEAEPQIEPPRKVRLPRRAKPDFIIRIESARGERMQVAVHRFFGRVRTSDGQSARQFCRGLEQLLTKSA
jgi:hypothetical protein